MIKIISYKRCTHAMCQRKRLDFQPAQLLPASISSGACHQVSASSTNGWNQRFRLFLPERQDEAGRIKGSGNERRAGSYPLHILFEAPPSIGLAKMVNGLKTGSSRMTRKNFPDELAPYYWKPVFWSMSYFICTASDRNAETLKRYIQDQDIK